MEEWMKHSAIEDVSAAIQSQTIQTALERNVSDLSPQALQSFLTQAPIPRFYYTGIIGTYNSGATTTVTWGTTNSVDPYTMFNPATGTATIPIDGLYSINLGIKTNGTSVGGYIELSLQQGATLLISNTLSSQGAALTNFYGMSVPLIIPMRAGSFFSGTITQTTGAAFTAGTFASSHFGCVWIAPYSNYQGGQN